MQLAVADVERDHAGRAALQQDVGEAAGGCADVEAVAARRVDAERLERRARASPRPARRTAAPRESQLCSFVHLLARLLVAGHAAGQDEGLCLGATLCEPTLDEQHVEALFH